MYAFCLLGNHFHLLVSIRSKKQQQQLFELKEIRSKELRSPSRHLGNFFNSYSLSINKQEGRTGSLFERPFKRKEVANEVYFRRMVVYIHQNPIKHGFADKIIDYPFSSYLHYIHSDESFLNKEKTISLFEGIKSFKTAHQQEIDVSEDYTLE